MIRNTGRERMSKRPWTRLDALLNRVGGSWQVVCQPGGGLVAHSLSEDQARALADAYNALPALAEALKAWTDWYDAMEREGTVEPEDRIHEGRVEAARAALAAAGL